MTNKEVFKTIFGIKSIFALAIANLLVIFPFVFWTYLVMTKQSGITDAVIPFDIWGMISRGGIVSLVGTVFIALPTLYRYFKKNKTSDESFLKELWILIGVVAAISSVLFSLPNFTPVLALLSLFTALCIISPPALVAGLGYWLIMFRDKIHKKNICSFIALYVGYNFLMYNFASLTISD